MVRRMDRAWGEMASFLVETAGFLVETAKKNVDAGTNMPG